MKIFRGPSTRLLEDAAHELVSEIDTEKSGSFLDDSVVVVANLTKEPNERQAIAHVQFNAADILALHRRLLTGLTAKSNDLDKLTARMHEASQALYRLYQRLDEDRSDSSAYKDRLADLESKLAEALDIVGALASKLDDR
jgi:hypothetical protein